MNASAASGGRRGADPGTGRAGFIALAGRPNAGKSTLVNRLIGRDIAIASPHPQTTRHLVRGVVNAPGLQIALLDAPGTHRPRTLLGERLNAVAQGAWSQVDAVCWCLAADEEKGRGDSFVGSQIAAAGTAAIVAVTKIDRVTRDDLARDLDAVRRLTAEAGIDPIAFVPLSAATGENMPALLDVMAHAVPVGPPIFDADDVTNQTDVELVAELVRRAALLGVRDELPHSIAVTVEEMGPRPGRPPGKPLIDIDATVHVERPGQKGIVIGNRGVRLREVGRSARRDIERLLGAQVFLRLHVRVAKDWQRDPRLLDRFGY